MFLVKLRKYLNALRIKEVALMCGFFIIGSLFSIEAIDNQNLINLWVIVLLSFSIIMSIYSFNAGAGTDKDIHNKRLKNLNAINKSSYYSISAIFFVLSSILSLYFSFQAIFFVIAIISLWVLYSHRRFGLKQKAIWGTIIHFISQILHFNLGYLAFKQPNIDSLLISIIFAIAFSIGHLLHEIIDSKSDLKSNLKTSPIVFGISKTINAIIILSTTNCLLLLLLYYTKTINNITFFTFIFPLVFHCILFMYYKNKMDTNAIIIRTYHRIIFFIGGFAFIVLQLFCL